jgi:predicted SnoaL-like aldol condensation-catalyzing enzyme
MKNTKTLALALLLALHAAALPAAHAADVKPTASKGTLHRDTAAANKALVLQAYQALFGDHDLGAVDRYWAQDYIQHNPYMADGTEAVKQYVEKIGLLKGPKFKVEFLRVAAEGDLVFLQTRQPKMGDNPEMVIVDIFRVAHGKIAEHWDVMQAVPADAVNKRPMY